eukprot:6188841-Pleurochrysis_carterae.AAC.3
MPRPFSLYGMRLTSTERPKGCSSRASASACAGLSLTPLSIVHSTSSVLSLHACKHVENRVYSRRGLGVCSTRGMLRRTPSRFTDRQRNRALLFSFLFSDAKWYTWWLRGIQVK